METFIEHGLVFSASGALLLTLLATLASMANRLSARLSAAAKLLIGLLLLFTAPLSYFFDGSIFISLPSFLVYEATTVPDTLHLDLLSSLCLSLLGVCILLAPRETSPTRFFLSCFAWVSLFVVDNTFLLLLAFLLVGLCHRLPKIAESATALLCLLGLLSARDGRVWLSFEEWRSTLSTDAALPHLVLLVLLIFSLAPQLERPLRSNTLFAALSPLWAVYLTLRVFADYLAAPSLLESQFCLLVGSLAALYFSLRAAVSATTEETIAHQSQQTAFWAFAMVSIASLHPTATATAAPAGVLLALSYALHTAVFLFLLPPGEPIPPSRARLARLLVLLRSNLAPSLGFAAVWLSADTIVTTLPQSNARPVLLLSLIVLLASLLLSALASLRLLSSPLAPETDTRMKRIMPWLLVAPLLLLGAFAGILLPLLAEVCKPLSGKPLIDFFFTQGSKNAIATTFLSASLLVLLVFFSKAPSKPLPEQSLSAQSLRAGLQSLLGFRAVREDHDGELSYTWSLSPLRERLQALLWKPKTRDFTPRSTSSYLGMLAVLCVAFWLWMR